MFSEAGVSVRPVIIHRAVLGSVERMTAILAENYGGRWPFWLSPRQAKIICIHKVVNEYAENVRSQIFDAGFEVDFFPDTQDTLNKQIRTAELERYNFILVVGPKEVENGTVNVRTGGNVVSETSPNSQFVSRITVKSRSQSSSRSSTISPRSTPKTQTTKRRLQRLPLEH